MKNNLVKNKTEAYDGVKIVFDTSFEKLSVTLEGELKINNIVFLKNRIQEEVYRYKEVIIKISNTKKIDLSAIQFFYELKKLLDIHNIYFVIQSDLSEEQQNIIQKCGYIIFNKNKLCKI